LARRERSSIVIRGQRGEVHASLRLTRQLARARGERHCGMDDASVNRSQRPVCGTVPWRAEGVTTFICLALTEITDGEDLRSGSTTDKSGIRSLRIEARIERIGRTGDRAQLNGAV